MTNIPYNPFDWYWSVDGYPNHVWSSHSGSPVTIDNKRYQKFLEFGGLPTKIASLDDLYNVLKSQGVSTGDLPKPSSDDLANELDEITESTERNELAIHAIVRLIARELGYTNEQAITAVKSEMKTIVNETRS